MTYWDQFASDLDHHAHVNGWSVDEAQEDWCDEHQQRGSTCGPCHTAGTLPSVDDSPLVAAVVAALAGKGYRHLADSDEETGAGLAARFAGEVK